MIKIMMMGRNSNKKKKSYIKNIIIFLLYILTTGSLFAQSPFTEKDQKKLGVAVDAFSIFIDNGDRDTVQSIPYDYMRDDYKRPKDSPYNEELSPFVNVLNSIEMHMEAYFSYGIHNNTFKMDNVFFTLGETFNSKYFSISPFITINGYFDTHNPDEEYNFTKGNIGLYDGGVQVVALNHLLVSLRGRATFDIDTTTYMLMPHYVDRTNPTSYDAPHWYMPTVLNGAGIRVGVIGNYYELAYSQGDYRHSIPKAVMFRLNLPYFSARLLYQHENRKDPANYNISLFESLVQSTFVGTIPIEGLGQQFWVNLIAEYTWKEGDAHYVRLEQGFEWNILNVALRELFYISKNSDEEMFLLEYTVYCKLQAGKADFSIGFQGATDNRYYILSKVEF